MRMFLFAPPVPVAVPAPGAMVAAPAGAEDEWDPSGELES